LDSETNTTTGFIKNKGVCDGYGIWVVRGSGVKDFHKEVKVMKTIGLIGGMSWESTVPYYKIVNETNY
jgi:hypothetical protein